MDALDNQLQEPESLSLGELDAIRDSGLQIGREIGDTAEFALEAVYSSQDRSDIAADFTEQLNEQGLTICEDGFRGSDPRAAHRLRMKNPMTGFEIVITQTPEVQADGTVANRLESDILNYGTNNEAHGDSIARSLLNSLSGIGLEHTEVCTKPGFETTTSDRVEIVDIAAWKEEHQHEVARPDHQSRMETAN